MLLELVERENGEDCLLSSGSDSSATIWMDLGRKKDIDVL